jgi:hypothetical protein
LIGTWRVAFADFVRGFGDAGMDRRIAQDKIIGFALGLGKQDRTATGIDFSGDVDTKQYTLTDANTKSNCLIVGILFVGKCIMPFHLDTAVSTM